MTTQAEYLAGLAELHAQRWPAGVTREPYLPFGHIPLSDILSRWAALQPDKPAIDFYGAALSYGDLDDLSTRLAWLLGARGIGAGDRVAVFMPNCPQYLITFFGILKLGAVLVPVNPMFKEVELRHELLDTGARLIIASDQLTDLLDRVIGDTPLEGVIVTSVGEMAPANPDVTLPAVLLDAKRVPPGATDLLPALAATTHGPDLTGRASLDAIAAINYTGGSTGLPKGCIHTQGDMVYTASTTVPMALQLTQDANYLCVLPVFWMAGEVFGIVFPIHAGATVSLLTRWDALTVMQTIQRNRVTHTTLLVDGLVEIMQHPALPDHDMSSLRITQGVSFVKKLNPEFRRMWRDLVGTTLREVGWGMTETHTCDTLNFGFDKDDFDLNSEPIFVGLPVPGTEFKIADFQTGALKGLGEQGELCIRSPSLLKGYWNSPGETARALRDGWLHTGDNGYFDEYGFLHYLGRNKEMLKVNGMSVFPGEIEAMLGQYPHVLGSGVVGRADADRGEVPVAFVILKPEHRTPEGEAAFATWCRAMISNYKQPELRFTDTLPMTDTGKVKKDLLKLRLAEPTAA